MNQIPAWLLRKTAVIEPFEGNSSKGPVYGDPVEVRCFFLEQTRVVVGPDGESVTSSTTVYTRLDVECPAKSRVTLPTGRRSTVIQAVPQDSGGLPTPDHLEIQLV